MKIIVEKFEFGSTTSQRYEVRPSCFSWVSLSKKPKEQKPPNGFIPVIIKVTPSINDGVYCDVVTASYSDAINIIDQIDSPQEAREKAKEKIELLMK